MSKGKQPRTKVNKVPKLLLSEMKVVVIQIGQGMGLEAAIFWRSRNRALAFKVSIIWYICYICYIDCMDKRTENLTDLNNIPKLCPYIFIYSYILCLWGSGTLGKPKDFSF